MKIGKLRVEPVFDGELWLDGGAMFGVVPRKLWAEVAPPDTDNRIRLGMYPLLLFTEPLTLIDTGVSNKSNEKMKKIYAIDGGHLLESLASFDVKPDDIGIVINTHLHFDHGGGNTWQFDDGIRPTFPKARYIVQKKEWADATNPNERTRASYLKENLEPIKDQVETVDGEHQILPGIFVVPTGGHTPGHQIIRIESEGKIAVYLGDLIPTVAHLPLPYIMGYDLMPVETLNKKKELLARAAREDWILFFEHDPKIRCGKVRENEGKYELQPIS
ncbi:MAG TPA: MBL fold metallo-hydrolase [bacterium (Candidatus Stahlbacteria)]|nr:MBL fold metallo-hydrolase [Candidatus Stahlbacteria bacterium]